MSARAAAQIGLVMFLWAICYPLITVRITLSPHLSFAALRALIAAAVLLGLAFWLGRPFPRGRQAWMSIVIVGVGATSLGFLGMFHAAEFVSPGIATVIASMQPLLAAVLAGLVLGERLSAKARVGLAIGLLGILVIVAPKFLGSGSQNYVLGIAFVVLAALGVTVSNVMIKRIAGSIDGLMVMGLQTLIGSIPLIAIALLTEDPGEIQWTPNFLVSLVGLDVFGTAVVYWLWIDVLARVSLSQANAFSFLVPVLGLSMGILLFGETLSLIQVGGIVLTVIGVAAVASGSDQSVNTTGGSVVKDGAKHPRGDVCA